MNRHRRSLIVASLVLAAALAAPHSARAGELRTGLKPTPPAEYVQFPEWTPARAAPVLEGSARPGIGYRDEVVDLRPYMPPPGNQGRQGSCVAWSVAYGAMTYLEAVRRGRPPRDASDLLSPAFLYNQINGGKDEGSQFPDALAVAQDIGGVPLEAMPYDDSDPLRQPTGDLLTDARANRTYGYARLASLTDIRNALAMRLPVVIALETSDKFMQMPTSWEVYREQDWRVGILHRQAGRLHGLHAVLLVGYDDRRRAILMQNSWGTSWGHGGYAWLAYDLFDAIAPDGDHAVLEAWVVFSGHGVHPRAAAALGVPSYVQGDLFVETSADRQEDATWSWHVGITPGEKPIARVDWTYEDASGRLCTADGDGSEGDRVLRGRRREGGVVDVSADVRFGDGTTQHVTARVFLVERFRPLRIRFRDGYWGRDEGVPRWVWEASLSGPGDLLGAVRRVTWELDPSYPNDRIVQTPSTPGGFFISARASRPTRLDAVVESEEGGRVVTRRLRCATAFFSAIEDRPRILVLDGTDERGAFLGLSLLGPLVDLDEVDAVTWAVEGSSPRRVDRDRGGDAFALDVRLPARPTGAFLVRGRLHLRDGSTRDVEERFVPAGG